MILQIKKKFKKSTKFVDYDFDDWERDARLDGWACRHDQDCAWIDEKLGCNDYGFEPSTIKVTDKNCYLFALLHLNATPKIVDYYF